MAARRKHRPVTVGRIKHMAAEAARQSGTGATGFTLLKMRASPLARLIDSKARIDGHQVGPEELAAAQDIATAFQAIAGALMIRPQTLERVDRSHRGFEPMAVTDAKARYKAWADHWSVLAKRGDRTLAVVIAVVVDERALSVIEADLGIRHGRARRALVRGLRDYAVRAGWIKGAVAEAWASAADESFSTLHPDLALAIARARVAD